MKTTLPGEDDFKGGWPHRKITTKKEHLTGRQTQWKKNSHKQNMKLIRPQQNVIIKHLKEDNIGGNNLGWIITGT